MTQYPAMMAGVTTGTTEALRHAHEFFERHSGWAPPDPETLAEWLADGVCRCPDECLVTPEGWREHGIASWKLVLDDLARHDDSAARGRQLDGSRLAAASRRNTTNSSS
jgi:hypothetical protein